MKLNFLFLLPVCLSLLLAHAQNGRLTAPQTYTIKDLGVISGYVWGINDSSQVVGDSFLWTKQLGLLDLATLTGHSSIGHAVNNAGQIAGAVYVNGAFLHAFLWSKNAGMKDLGTLPSGDFSVALGLNELGQAVGYSNSAPNSKEFHATLWTADARIQDLGTLPGGDGCEALGINNSGQIVGYCGFANNPLVHHAFLGTTAAGMQDLGTLLGGNFSEAHAINDLGQVVGLSNMPRVHAEPELEYVGHAFVWSEKDGMQDLGALSNALAINDLGQVVGYSVTNNALTGSVAVIFEGSAGPRDLNNLIPPYSGFLLIAATDINRSGHIAVVGYVPPLGTFHALVLIPAAQVQQ